MHKTDSNLVSSTTSTRSDMPKDVDPPELPPKKATDYRHSPAPELSRNLSQEEVHEVHLGVRQLIAAYRHYNSSG